MSVFSKLNLKALSSSVVFSAILTGPALAQLQANELEEIVVTAQKREQTLGEVPISLAIIDSELLDNAGIDDFTSAADMVPNFNFYQGFDRSEVAVNIRGLTSGTSNPGIDPSVGFFIDGVYIARPAALTGKFLGVERIEVLRGPQGTLYGRNTSTGAVNIYTKNPGNEFEANIKTGIANYGEYSVSGTASAPFSNDSGGWVVSGQYTQGDSFLDDEATGKPLGEKEDYGFFGKLVLTPNEKTTVKISGDYSENTSSSANLVGPFIKRQSDVRAVFDAARLTMNPQLAGLVRAVQDVPIDTFDRKVGRSDEEQSDDLEQFGIAVDFSYELPVGTFTSITSYRESEDFAAVDPDITPDDLFFTSVKNDDQQFSQELRLVSDNDGRLNYLLGAYYFDAEFTANTQTAFGVPLFGLFNASQPANPIVAPQRANSITNQDVTSLALFGQLIYDLSDNITLTYGFRYNDEEKNSTINQNPDRGINASSGIPFPLQFPVLLGLGSEVSDSDFINTINLNWELSQFSNLYFSYSEGLKSGGINANILLDTNSLTFKKETSNNFEVGFRTTRSNGITLSSALFYTEFNDLQIATFDPSNPSNIIVTNAGSAEIFGVEADLSWPITERFSINTAVAYNDSEYKDTVLPGFNLGSSPALPNLTLQLPSVKDVSGRTLSRAPELSLSVGAQYDFNFRDSARGVIRADYSYVDSQFLDPILSPQSEIDSYNIVNLRASVFSKDDVWKLSIYSNNVFDEEFYTQLIASPGSAALGVNPGIATWLGAQGSPNVYGIEISRKFN